MSYKKLSAMLLTVFIGVGCGMVHHATKLKLHRGALFVNGSQFFPMLIGALMILFSVISMIDTLRKPEDESVSFPKIGKVGVTLALTLLWAALWLNVGYFYSVSFIFIALFIHIFNPAPNSLSKIRRTLISDAIIIATIYLIFAVGLKVHL